MLLVIYLYAIPDAKYADEKPPPLGVFQICQGRLTDSDDTEFELSTVNRTHGHSITSVRIRKQVTSPVTPS